MGTTQDLNRILELVSAGQLKPQIDRIYPFDEVHQAHERLQTGQQIGKIVLEW